MDIRHGVLRVTARPDSTDGVALAHICASPNGDRPEVRERHGVAVRGLDRDALAADRDCARERDCPGLGCAHGDPRHRADVDPAVLARRVRVVAELKPLQDRPLHRPRPRGRIRDEGKRDDRAGDEHPHRFLSLLSELITARLLYLWYTMLSSWTTKTCRKAAYAVSPSGERPRRPPGGARLPPPRARPRPRPPRRDRPRPRRRPQRRSRR